MTVLLQRLHARLGDFWCRLKPGCALSDLSRVRQIAAHLAALGLKPEDRYFFGNDLLAVTDVSAQSDNVLLDDAGQLRFIDPLIRLKNPALDVIKELIGTLNT